MINECNMLGAQVTQPGLITMRSNATGASAAHARQQQQAITQAEAMLEQQAAAVQEVAAEAEQAAHLADAMQVCYLATPQA